MKDTELKVVVELMKNSRRSDRELARAIGMSQPTVTRTRTGLEKRGIIKEYTMVQVMYSLVFSSCPYIHEVEGADFKGAF